MNLFSKHAREKALQTAVDLLRDESGTTAIEYALVGALISTGIILGAVAFSDSARNVWNYASDTIVAALS